MDQQLPNSPMITVALFLEESSIFASMSGLQLNVVLKLGARSAEYLILHFMPLALKLSDREVLGHRCLIEGLEKRGEEWFVPASSPAAKVENTSIDAEVVAIERNIKSLRIAIEDKANRIQSLESQLRTERSTLATLEANLLQAEAAFETASTVAANQEKSDDDDDNDEAMPPANDSCTPSKGIS